MFWRRKKKKGYVSDFKETEKVEGKIGIGGSGISGNSEYLVFNVAQYERMLHSIRLAREKIPDLPIPDGFLEHGATIYSELSAEAQIDLQILTPKQKTPQAIKYSAETKADWVLPYLEELIKSYSHSFELLPKSITHHVPLLRDVPIGFNIILSQISGLRVDFLRRTKVINYATADAPLDRDFIVNGQKMNVLSQCSIRIRSDNDPNILWTIIFGTETPDYFTIERAKSDGEKYAEADRYLYPQKKISSG